MFLQHPDQVHSDPFYLWKITLTMNFKSLKCVQIFLRTKNLGATMKSMESFAKRLVVGMGVFVCVAFISVAQAQTQQGKATVTAIKGSAEYSTGGSYMPLKVGTVLRSGSSIRTSGGSYVDLALGKNNGVMRVTEGTTLALDKLTYTETGADVVIETQVDL